MSYFFAGAAFAFAAGAAAFTGQVAETDGLVLAEQTEVVSLDRHRRDAGRQLVDLDDSFERVGLILSRNTPFESFGRNEDAFSMVPSSRRWCR